MLRLKRKSDVSNSDEQVNSDMDTQPSKGKFHFPDNAIILPSLYNRLSTLRGPESNYVASEQNIKLYSQLVNDREGRKFSKDKDQKGFIMKFIEQKMGGYIFFEFNAKQNKYLQVDSERLFIVIHKRFNNLRSRRSALLKKGKLDNTHSANHDDMDMLLAKDRLPYHVDDDNKASKDLLSSLKWVYKKKSKLFEYLDWNYFSMFHSLYQSFSFVVYNSSHILNDDGLVHRCTRVEMKFPPNANCALVTHGRLVHSGAESKTETEMSFNTSHDARLFAYLSNLFDRKTRIDKYKNHLEPDTVDRATFKLCDMNCKKCQAYNRSMKKHKIINNEINIIDYIELNNNAIGTRKNSLRQTPSRKLLGDLDELGWEVWTGIDTNLDKYAYLNSHLRTFVLGCGKALWNGIGSTPRKAMKIDKLLGEPNANIRSSLLFMTTVFHDIREHVLVHIPQLGPNIQFDGRAILANFDELEEQIPHRDFSSKKR